MNRVSLTSWSKLPSMGHAMFLFSLSIIETDDVGIPLSFLQRGLKEAACIHTTSVNLGGTLLQRAEQLPTEPPTTVASDMTSWYQHTAPT